MAAWPSYRVPVGDKVYWGEGRSNRPYEVSLIDASDRTLKFLDWITLLKDVPEN